MDVCVFYVVTPKPIEKIQLATDVHQFPPFLQTRIMGGSRRYHSMATTMFSSPPVEAAPEAIVKNPLGSCGIYSD